MQFEDRAAQLTKAFYDWERRGRGWQVWGFPVELEPPFRPFLGHCVPATQQPIDDARRPTLLSSIADRVRAWIEPTHDKPTQPSVAPIEEPEPEEAYDTSPVVEVQLTMPPGSTVNRETSEQLLLSLSYSARPLGFEIVGTTEAVQLQWTARKEDVPLLRDQVRAHVSEGVAVERSGYLKEAWKPETTLDSLVVDFGLRTEFMLPLQTVRSFSFDPLAGVVGALSGLETGEIGVLQVLFQAAHHPWSESILRAVRDGEGRPFFADSPETVRLAQDKVARPLFATVIRVASRSPRLGRAAEIARAVGGALRTLSSPPSNELIPLANDDYADKDHEWDLLSRSTRRSGMILNSAELVSLAHPPSAAVRSERFGRVVKRTKAAPRMAVGHALVLGDNTHADRTVEVTLSPSQRIRHTYVIGASGTGKSTLLQNMIVQDIMNGEGVGVLDPHGDLVDEILAHVPEHRLDDVVLLDPADKEYAVGLNLLSAHSDLEKQLLASDLVAVFRRLSTSWGDQMTSVLGNAVLAFLESAHGGTIADLRRFLVEKSFRRGFLETVTDPEVVYYWKREFPLLTGKPQAPLLTRLDTFLRPKLVRHMVCQKENRLDFAAIMNERKIFLAKLAQGAIGEENAYLLGAFLVSKLHQIAQSRQEVEEKARSDFYLYIDEFQNFLTPSMAAILSGARKYHLGLILAHQDLSQLGKRETGVFGAAISNPATRICFRVGDIDARRLEDGFAYFGASDLQSLGVGEAICRIEQAQHDFNLRTHRLEPPPPGEAREKRERVIALCREKYARRRHEVESTIQRPAPKVEIEPEDVPVAPVAEAPPPPEPVREQALPKKREPVAPPARPIPGRGGQEHKRLQKLVKLLGESRGYLATIEKKVLDGRGSVDVALEKDGISIACEISVTTSPEHEVANVQKCLDAGFGHVVVVFAKRQKRNETRKAVKDALSEKEQEQVFLLTQDEVLGFLDAREAESAGTETTIRGRRVKVSYRAPSEDEAKAREHGVSDAIRKASRRRKEE